MPQLDHPSLHAEPPHNVMPPKSNTIRRHLPATVEGGATYSLISYETPDVRAHSISHWRLLLEHKRPRWLREMVAEAFGVFSFVYSGVGANASFAVQETNEPGKIFTIGLAFALSLAFAVIVAGHVSGGHFNPAITLSFAIFRNFPWKKVPRYILAQTVGAFVAAVLVFAQYHQKIVEFENRVKASGGSFVTSSGPAAIFCPIPQPDQTFGYLLMNEYFVVTILSISLWAIVDPANPFVSPSSVPFALGLVYAHLIWCFAPLTISTNFARDLGPRMFTAIIYGREVFTYKSYAYISVLVNIPATIIGVGIYELFFKDN